MTWFFIALIGPLLYASSNHIDKVLLDKYFKNGGVGTLVLFSSLLSALALPFLFFADRSVLDVSASSILVLAVVGILNVLVLFCWLHALKNEEASVAVVFYQLVPVFGVILGYFVLGEVLSKTQLVAVLIIILGTTIISFEVDLENKFKLRKKTVIPMLLAAFFWALGSVIFKAVALEENLWRSLFWESAVLVLVGVFIFTFVRSYRENFLHSFRTNSSSILLLNVVNEILFILGNITFAYAYMLAPIGLVLLTESFQPIFVLLIGVFFAVFFPNIYSEKIRARNIWPKVLAILITGVGAYLLLSS